MNSRRISVRFNLDNRDDLAAWEYLHRLHTKSINKEIISMINASRQNQELTELFGKHLLLYCTEKLLGPQKPKQRFAK